MKTQNKENIVSPVIHKFSQDEAEKLGYYVYVYTDPRNDKPFYVGKGKGNRAFDHLKDGSETDKVNRIKEILDSGNHPRIEILASGLDQSTALKVEAAAIDLIGMKNLTNAQKGHNSREFGRRSIDSVHAELSADSLDKQDFKHNMVLIKINKSFADASDRTALELYDATRGTWVVKLINANKVEYGAAVYGGVIREVYRIAAWLDAGSTQRFDPTKNEDHKGRYEFVGKIASEEVRKMYRLKSVANFYKRGAANPIMYIGPAFRKLVFEE